MRSNYTNKGNTMYLDMQVMYLNAVVIADVAKYYLRNNKLVQTAIAK